MNPRHETPPSDAAPFAIACPICGGLLSAAGSLRGRAACCPLCAGRFMVPDAPLPAADEVPVPGAVDVPEETLALREPVLRIGRGGATVELRRLTDDERRIRRARRSMILLIVGAAVLVALVVVLGRPVRRP